MNGYTIQTLVQDGIYTQTVMDGVPQVQTIVQDGILLTSIINAPFVEVTSVNGMTGDVEILPGNITTVSDADWANLWGA